VKKLYYVSEGPSLTIIEYNSILIFDVTIIVRVGIIMSDVVVHIELDEVLSGRE